MKLKQIWMVYVVALVCAISLTACSSSKNSYSTHDKKSESAAPREERKEAPMDEPMMIDSEELGLNQKDFDLPSQEKFIIRTNLSVETKNFDQSVQKIEALTSQLKGYMERVEANYGTGYDRNYSRSIYYMIRIPKGSTGEAVKTIKSEVGIVVEEERSTENVTKRIRDTKRDIDLLKAKEDRLIDLSKRTEDIEALIKIETELAEIISIRESSQAELANLEYDVEYDFLSLNLREVRDTKVVEENTFWGDVKTAFRDSIDGMIYFCQFLILILVRTWIFLLLVILVVILIVFLSRRAAKKRKQALLNQMPYAPAAGTYQDMNSNPMQEEQK